MGKKKSQGGSFFKIGFFVLLFGGPATILYLGRTKDVVETHNFTDGTQSDDQSGTSTFVLNEKNLDMDVAAPAKAEKSSATATTSAKKATRKVEEKKLSSAQVKKVTKEAGFDVEAWEKAGRPMNPPATANPSKKPTAITVKQKPKAPAEEDRPSKPAPAGKTKLTSKEVESLVDQLGMQVWYEKEKKKKN